MAKYAFELSGVTPLLMHADSIEWADKMEEWRKDSENARNSKAGDDRTPAFRWLGSCYHDGKNLVIPSDMVQRSLMAAGAMIPTGKRGSTFKKSVMSGMGIPDEHCQFLVAGKNVPWAKLDKLMNERDFVKHQEAASALGFSLFIKRAAIGTSKHVRVRPRFEDWKVRGVIDVWDQAIDAKTLAEMFRLAGDRAGLGDWRPSGKTPGPFGRFTASVKEVDGE